MAEEGITGSIKKSVVTTDEAPFIPGEAKLTFVLKPIEGEEPFYPDVSPYADLPSGYEGELLKLDPEMKSLVINVETTGLMPFDSRITDIACIDPADPANPIFFFNEDEEVLVRDFLGWFASRGYNQIIGYNVAFDYRFLFAKACRFRLQVPGLPYLDLYDLAQIMKQIKQAFVFGFNKPGTLDQWTEYLFGVEPPMSQKAAIDAFTKKKYDLVRAYNNYKVRAAYNLYVLVKYVLGGDHG